VKADFAHFPFYKGFGETAAIWHADIFTAAQHFDTNYTILRVQCVTGFTSNNTHDRKIVFPIQKQRYPNWPRLNNSP